MIVGFLQVFVHEIMRQLFWRYSIRMGNHDPRHSLVCEIVCVIGIERKNVSTYFIWTWCGRTQTPNHPIGNNLGSLQASSLHETKNKPHLGEFRTVYIWFYHITYITSQYTDFPRISWGWLLLLLRSHQLGVLLGWNTWVALFFPWWDCLRLLALAFNDDETLQELLHCLAEKSYRKIILGEFKKSPLSGWKTVCQPVQQHWYAWTKARHNDGKNNDCRRNMLSQWCRANIQILWESYRNWGITILPILLLIWELGLPWFYL